MNQRKRLGRLAQMILLLPPVGGLIVGCSSAPAPASPVTQNREPATEPQPSFRAAEAKDLHMVVSTHKPGSDGFPAAVVQVWNNSTDEVLLEYQPASVTLHCGPFEQHGPADLFERRREILDPAQEINLTMPSGRWARNPTTGPRDLMLPSELPPGKYPLWATFKLPGNGSEILESDRDVFHVPDPKPPASQPAPLESFRAAESGDLQLTLSTHLNPSDHFPLATLRIYNVSKEQVIFGYEPLCIVFHCGDLEQHAPPLSFLRRREILRPGQPIEFEIAPGGWSRSPGNGEQELLIPATLPPGKYQTWATVRLAGVDSPLIQTSHDTFVVP